MCHVCQPDFFKCVQILKHIKCLTWKVQMVEHLWFCVVSMVEYKSVADPRFPVRGVDLAGGVWTPEASYVSKILYVETKEPGPLGGVLWARPPRSANANSSITLI